MTVDYISVQHVHVELNHLKKKELAGISDSFEKNKQNKKTKY